MENKDEAVVPQEEGTGGEIIVKPPKGGGGGRIKPEDMVPIKLSDVIAASKISKPATAMIPEGMTAEQEVKGKRTEISKTFKVEPGRFKSIYTPGMSAVHYKENPSNDKEQLKDIDLTMSAEGIMSKAPYIFTAFKDKVGYRMDHRDTGGWTEIELLQVGGEPVDFKNLSTKIDGNLFFWDGVAVDLGLYVALMPDRVRMVRALESEKTPRSFQWQIRQKDGEKVRFRNKTQGTDAKRRNCEIVNDTNIGPFVEGEYKSILFDESWTGNISTVVDRKNRQKDWTTEGIAYPILIS